MPSAALTPESGTAVRTHYTGQDPPLIPDLSNMGLAKQRQLLQVRMTLVAMPKYTRYSSEYLLHSHSWRHGGYSTPES